MKNRDIKSRKLGVCHCIGKIACWAFYMSILQNPAHAESAMHDDGLVTPYVPPQEQIDYFQQLDPSLLPTMKADPARIEKWQDDRFGVFMHWDPSCQITAAMSWSRNGRRPHHRKDGEHSPNGIPTEIYDNQYKTFNPVKFDADQWIRMIKDAGAKYFVFTAKHHQGFCMFDSAVTDYDIMSTPFKRDICKELADACHKYGIELYFYYSQPDWTEERYRADVDSPEFDKYRTEFLEPQLRELVTNYGRLGGIWWDGLGQHPDRWNTPGLFKMMRTQQPHLISNHRCAPRNWRFGDFDGPEKEIGRFQINRPWETWSDCIGMLVRCAGNGGNLLLNTGPAPDGSIEPRHVERYLQMGAWLKQYGESVYATRGGPYMPGPWGCATRGKEGNRMYLHLLGHWDGMITLPDLEAKVVGCEVLTGGTASVKQENGRLTVRVNDGKKRKRTGIIHEFDTVIALDLDRPAMEVPVVSSVGDSATVGAQVTASSEVDEANPAQAVVAADATEFSEGTFVRALWKPARDDKAPWIEVEFKEPRSISQIQMQEGRYGNPSAIVKFTISARINGQWNPVYKGSGVGNSFGLVLPQAVETDALRIDFLQWSGGVSLNLINAY